MKAGIHPKYVKSTVVCACGNTWETMSTKENMRTDLCSKCHPFYTGEQRIVDTAGQVERFMRRMGNRSEQADRQAAIAKRGSKNKANVPPPPQERRPAATTENANTEDAAQAETAEA